MRIKEDDDINKLHHHEKKCSNRAITRPRVEYKKEVAMIKFEEHAIENNCIDHWDDMINGHCPEGNDFEWPYGYYEDSDSLVTTKTTELWCPGHTGKTCHHASTLPAPDIFPGL